MDDRLKGFFRTAQQKAGETLAAENAATAHKAAEEQARAENMRLLKAQVAEELGPILDILQGLPAKDGKRFSVTSWTGQNERECSYNLTVSYDSPDTEPWPAARSREQRTPTIGMHIARNTDGRLDFDITQYSIIAHQGTALSGHRNVTAHDFETARQELALGLGTFAADRMNDIASAPAGTAAADAAPAAPPKDDRIHVFKPVSLKSRHPKNV